jgi:hypothetical protein
MSKFAYSLALLGAMLFAGSASATCLQPAGSYAGATGSATISLSIDTTFAGTVVIQTLSFGSTTPTSTSYTFASTDNVFDPATCLGSLTLTPGSSNTAKTSSHHHGPGNGNPLTLLYASTEGGAVITFAAGGESHGYQSSSPIRLEEQ